MFFNPVHFSDSIHTTSQKQLSWHYRKRGLGRADCSKANPDSGRNLCRTVLEANAAQRCLWLSSPPPWSKRGHLTESILNLIRKRYQNKGGGVNLSGKSDQKEQVGVSQCRQAGVQFHWQVDTKASSHEKALGFCQLCTGKGSRRAPMSQAHKRQQLHQHRLQENHIQPRSWLQLQPNSLLASCPPRGSCTPFGDIRQTVHWELDLMSDCKVQQYSHCYQQLTLLSGQGRQQSWGAGAEHNPAVTASSALTEKWHGTTAW